MMILRIWLLLQLLLCVIVVPLSSSFPSDKVEQTQQQQPQQGHRQRHPHAHGHLSRKHDEINTVDTYVVLTRMYYDYAFLSHFISWHLSLGFDYIYIICTEDETERDPNFHLDHRFRSRVEIMYDESDLNPDLIMDRYVEMIRKRNHTWVLSIDLDEYMVLSRDHKDVQSYVHAMESQFNVGHIDLFQLHWGLLEYISPKCPNVTLGYMINHTTIHHSPLTKSLVRLKYVQNIRSSHYPTFLKHYTPNVYVDHSIVHQVVVQHKPNQYSYKYASLLHIRTRGFSDNIMKAINTRFEEKKSHTQPLELLRFLESTTEKIRQGQKMKLIDAYVQYVGLKAYLPLSHTTTPVISLSHALVPPLIMTEQLQFCDQSVEFRSLLRSFSFRMFINITDDRIRQESALNLTTKFQNILGPALTTSYKFRLHET